MIILYFADIFGRPGRKAVQACIGDLRATYTPDFIIGNVENLAGGRGVNRRTLEELNEMGFSAYTSGNHIWDNKEVYQLLGPDSKLIRPANWSSPEGEPCPGRGMTIVHRGNLRLAIINVMGRVFMDAQDCPFHAVDRLLKEVPPSTPVLVDMHADATSEKYAMGWHLAGKVSAVVGSHSHVQTADERILPGGTAYITDVGMTGAFDSVIGLKPEGVIKKFITKRPHPTQAAKENPGVSCVVIKLNSRGHAESIERLRFTVKIDDLAQGGDLE
ncbi:MAG: YmdB family metallophosphoesterase [Proteobacteria bacterium]|nr:YmdB family metallophosphoesterase [Pseudomonadota bacterium]NBY19461.1 YmdB family metallophosphoesterase [bacterium]